MPQKRRIIPGMGAIAPGYYSYGERKTDPRRRQPGRRWSGRVVVPAEEYYPRKEDPQ
jgi:hypothetical protein